MEELVYSFVEEKKKNINTSIMPIYECIQSAVDILRIAQGDLTQ